MKCPIHNKEYAECGFLSHEVENEGDEFQLKWLVLFVGIALVMVVSTPMILIYLLFKNL